MIACKNNTPSLKWKYGALNLLTVNTPSPPSKKKIIRPTVSLSNVLILYIWRSKLITTMWLLFFRWLCLNANSWFFLFLFILILGSLIYLIWLFIAFKTFYWQLYLYVFQGKENAEIQNWRIYYGNWVKVTNIASIFNDNTNWLECIYWFVDNSISSINKTADFNK